MDEIKQEMVIKTYLGGVTLGCHLTRMILWGVEVGVRLGFESRQQNKVTPFPGNPYLTAVEWAMVWAAVDDMFDGIPIPLVSKVDLALGEMMLRYGPGESGPTP